jgi:hypothetical protein
MTNKYRSLSVLLIKIHLKWKQTQHQISGFFNFLTLMKIAISAAETSGDLIGAKLVSALKAQNSDIQIKFLQYSNTNCIKELIKLVDIENLMLNKSPINI